MQNSHLLSCISKSWLWQALVNLIKLLLQIHHICLWSLYMLCHECIISIGNTDQNSTSLSSGLYDTIDYKKKFICLHSARNSIEWMSNVSTHSIRGLSLIPTARFSCCLELMFVHSILNVNRQYQILKLNSSTYGNCECYKLNLTITCAYMDLTHKNGWTEISAQNISKALIVCSTQSRSLHLILSTRMIRFLYTIVIWNKFWIDFRKHWIQIEKPSNHLDIFPCLSQIATE